eukprot:2660149-Rhodomonas_salina.3
MVRGQTETDTATETETETEGRLGGGGCLCQGQYGSARYSKHLNTIMSRNVPDLVSVECHRPVSAECDVRD